MNKILALKFYSYQTIFNCNALLRIQKVVQISMPLHIKKKKNKKMIIFLKKNIISCIKNIKIQNK